MSWTRAASRTTGRLAGAASTVRSVWSQRSSPGTLFWGIPRWAARSGAITASSPVSSASRRPMDGRGAASSFSSSAPIRSPDRWATSPALARIAASVSGSIVEPQGGRQPHGPDHAQRVLAEARLRVADRAQEAAAAGPRRRRTGPPGRSAVVGRRPPQAMALTVKSRRARSATTSVAELHPVRPAEVGVVVLAAERRDLETSSSRRTATVPNRFS